jgi:type I restriction enzyme S subunit
MKTQYDYSDQEYKETELGLLPKEWSIIETGKVAKFQGGFAFKSKVYSKAGIRLFKITNVSFGKVFWKDVTYLPEIYSKKYKDFLLNEGDLVMAMTRPIVSGGIKVAQIKSRDTPCLLNQRVGKFIFDKTKINSRFFYFFIFTEVFKDAVSSKALVQNNQT